MNKRTFAPLVALLTLTAPALGQGIKLNAFPSASAISSGDLVPVGQGGAGTTYKSTVGAISNYVLNSGGLSGDCTITALNIYCTKTNGANFGSLATASAAAPPALGGTTPNAGAFTNLSSSGTVSGTGFSTYLAAPPAIGGTTPAAGSFSTLSASGAVSGTGFSTYLASPPSIGATTAAAGKFTTLQATGALTTNVTGTVANCLQANSSGVVSGTGTACGSGGGGTPANPTATASDTAVNGTATTFMRSDAAPAVQKGSSSQFGVMECDNVTVACPGGVIQSNGQVVAGTTQTVTATQWGRGTTFVVSTAAQTLTLPVSSTLSTNGGVAIQTIGQSVTLTPNASDAINGGTAGANQTISAGLTAYVTTDGAGNVRVSPTSAAGSGTVTSVICGTGLSGGTITSTGTCSLNLGNANAWTGQQSFVSVLGSENAQSGTTYTLVATDCGKTVSFSNASAVTVTIPASIVPAAGTTCNIIIRQDGAGQVAVNGSAVSAATLVTHVASSAATKTAGAHAVIGLQLSTISSVATAVLTGDGA